MVLTPEKAVVSFKVAGVGSRAMAHVLDVCILTAVFIAMAVGFSQLAVIWGIEVTAGLIGFAVSAGMFLYFILFEWLWNGITPGKKAMGVRVVSLDGTPITMRGAVYRNLLRPADFAPVLYFAGFIASFMNEKSQRLGDLAAGTLVIYEPKPNAHYQIAPHKAGVHPFEDSVGQLATMTMEEYFAIKRLCDRFPELPPTVQARSVEGVWRPFAEKEKIEPLPGIHPVYQMEAVVMKYGRRRKLF